MQWKVRLDLAFGIPYRSPLVAATFLQMLGYVALRYIYDHPQTYLAQSAQGSTDASLSRLGLLVVMGCMCATGAGSAAGLMSGISCVARVFPPASVGNVEMYCSALETIADAPISDREELPARSPSLVKAFPPCYSQRCYGQRVVEGFLLFLQS